MTREQELAIENNANRLISECIDIKKSMMDKAEAEKDFGFSLYQGGIVPGNQLRVVNITGVDTEACCGTHGDNTAEVGWIKIIKSQRISDGIVRLYYCARERAMDVMNNETKILNNLCKSWSVDLGAVEQTAARFFKESKTYSSLCEKQEKQILGLQMKVALSDAENHKFFVKSDQDAPTLYIGQLPQYAQLLKDKKKGVCFLGSNFVIGLFGEPSLINLDDIKAFVEKTSSKKPNVRVQDKVSFKFKEKNKAPVNATGVCQFMITGENLNVEKLVELLTVQGIVELE